MGLFSWFSTTVSKTNPAVLIQMAFEGMAKVGLIESQPVALATRVVEAAYTRVPNLKNAKYNKHVMAVSILAMAPALPSLSNSDREASKHALGMLVKHVFELQMSNSLALTLSEQGLVEQAKQAFLASTETTPGFNLGPSFDEAPPSAIRIEAESSFECIAAERNFIDRAYGINRPWTLQAQSLVETGGKVYDKFEIILSDGTNKTVWFDITSSWEKWHVAIPENRCPQCDSTISSEQAQAKMCTKCDRIAQPKEMLNTTIRGAVELPGFTPSVGDKNLSTATTKPSTTKPFVLPVLVIAGTVAMLVTFIASNGTTPSIPKVGVKAEKGSQASPQLATLSDVLRGLGHSWDERKSEGEVLYRTMPKGEKLAGLRQYIGQPLRLKLIHTAKLLDSNQELLFFSSTPISKDPKESYDCHACAPLLSAMVVSQIAGKGLVVDVPLEPMTFVGEWGKVKMSGRYAPSVVEIGPKVTGFTLLHTESHQGEDDSWTTLYAIKGNHFHALGAFESATDNLGASPCYEKRSRDTCKKTSTIPTFNRNVIHRGYYEVVTDTSITYVDDGVEEYATSKARLRFNGKQYAPVEAANETRVTKSHPSAPPESSGGTDAVRESALSVEKSKTQEELMILIVKRQLKGAVALTRAEHTEFWRLMSTYSSVEQANLLKIVRVNLLGAAKHQIALFESASISATNGKVVKTAELIESTVETRRVFLTALPVSLSPTQRENLIRTYDARRAIADRNNDAFLKSAAAGTSHYASDEQVIATDAASLRTYPAILRQGVDRVLRLIDPIWRDEIKAQH